MASGITAIASVRVMGANDLIRVGLIGCGGRSRDLLRAADAAGGYKLIAACDVYEPRRDEVRDTRGTDISTHLDYRDLLSIKELDAVTQPLACANGV